MGGATSRDGSSEGITMALALYSLAIGKAVRNGIGMTGEFTLTGRTPYSVFQAGNRMYQCSGLMS